MNKIIEKFTKIFYNNKINMFSKNEIVSKFEERLYLPK